MKIAFFVLVATSIVSGAHAQTQLRATSRAVSLTWGIGPGDVSADSGFIPGAPATALSSAWDTSAERGASGNCNAQCGADYSGFHFTAGGSAQTSGAGMFLSASGTGSIDDQITITSNSLPVGTPVLLTFRIATTGQAQVLDLQPQVGIVASFGLCSSQNLTGFGSLSQTCSSTVGSTFNWPRTFSATLSADRLPGVGPVASSLAASIRVQYTIEVLTAGASVIASSGHNYAPRCPADLDDGSGNGTFDGAVDINDLLFFLTQFEIGAAAVDLDNGSGTGTPDGGVDINDLLFFLTRFEAGC